MAAVAGLALLLGAIALGVGRDRRAGGDFDAAASTFRALQRAQALYHFRSVSRLTEEPPGIAQSHGGAFLFPLVQARAARPSYDEIWITPGGRRVRWVRYRGPAGDLLSAAAFVQPPRQVRGLPKKLRARLRAPTCRETGRPEPPIGVVAAGLDTIGPPSDPATAFVSAYCAGRIQSKGAANLDGRPVWRFVTRRSARGSRQEWLVDRSSWLPVRYAYVDHNQQAGRRYVARLTVQFLVFEVLPLNADSRRLLHLTPAQRKVCRAAQRHELARARAHLSPRRYRMAVEVMRRHNACR